MCAQSVMSAESCLTLCDLMDCSPEGSSVFRIPQARILEWVTMPASRGSSWLRDWTGVSCIAGRFITHWATWEGPHRLVITAQIGPLPPTPSPEQVSIYYHMIPAYSQKNPLKPLSHLKRKSWLCPLPPWRRFIGGAGSGATTWQEEEWDSTGRSVWIMSGSQAAWLRLSNKITYLMSHWED